MIKTKTTKQNVEGIIRYQFTLKFTYIPNEYSNSYEVNAKILFYYFYSNIRKLEDQREKLKSTVQEADDAETLAHDALASIDARAEEITERLKITNALQHNHTEMSFAIGMINFNKQKILLFT